MKVWAILMLIVLISLAVVIALASDKIYASPEEFLNDPANHIPEEPAAESSQKPPADPYQPIKNWSKNEEEDYYQQCGLAEFLFIGPAELPELQKVVENRGGVFHIDRPSSYLSRFILPENNLNQICDLLQRRPSATAPSESSVIWDMLINAQIPDMTLPCGTFMNYRRGVSVFKILWLDDSVYYSSALLKDSLAADINRNLNGGPTGFLSLISDPTIGDGRNADQLPLNMDLLLRISWLNRFPSLVSGNDTISQSEMAFICLPITDWLPKMPYAIGDPAYYYHLSDSANLADPDLKYRYFEGYVIHESYPTGVGNYLYQTGNNPHNARMYWEYVVKSPNLNIVGFEGAIGRQECFTDTFTTRVLIEYVLNRDNPLKRRIIALNYITTRPAPEIDARLFPNISNDDPLRPAATKQEDFRESYFWGEKIAFKEYYRPPGER